MTTHDYEYETDPDVPAYTAVDNEVNGGYVVGWIFGCLAMLVISCFFCGGLVWLVLVWGFELELAFWKCVIIGFIFGWIFSAGRGR